MHIVAGVAAAPQVTPHSVPALHTTVQVVSHFTVPLDESLKVTVLAAPTWILQVDIALHVTTAPSPSLKSQSESALQVTTLPSPPCPLHIEVSLHVAVNESELVPSHFAADVHASTHASSPQAVLQSAPAVHVHDDSAQTHPVPVQLGADVSPPQPTTTQHRTASAYRMRPPSRRPYQ